MNLKEKLQALKQSLLEENEEKYVSKKDISLNNKIEDFIKWYENDFLDYVYYKEDVKDSSLRLRKFKTNYINVGEENLLIRWLFGMNLDILIMKLKESLII